MTSNVAIPSDQPPTLADCTSPGLLVPELAGRDVTTVIQELSAVLARDARVPDRLAFVAAVLKRETQASSEMESGLAFPHARLAGLKSLSFAFGRSRQPLAWQSGGAPSVSLIFLLAVPADDLAPHLRLISGLSRLSRETRLMKRLRSLPDPGQIFDLFKQVPLAAATGSASSAKPILI